LAVFFSGKEILEPMDVYVARQPIFDQRKEIYGYELLFRDGLSNAFPEIDRDKATSKLLSNSFFILGIDHIAGGEKGLHQLYEGTADHKSPHHVST
jgi:c-di-GMP-related signal transduction protein